MFYYFLSYFYEGKRKNKEDHSITLNKTFRLFNCKGFPITFPTIIYATKKIKSLASTLDANLYFFFICSWSEFF